MSCQHGNHADACDLCDELNDSYKAGLAEGLSQQAERGDGAELVGYVDPSEVAIMQKNGGGVSVGPFSERYGRTHPVYYLRAPAEHGGRVDDETYAAIGKAFREVLADPSVAWRDTGAKEFIDRVCSKTAHLRTALAQNAQPNTLGDFVRLPDAERQQFGQSIAAGVDERMAQDAQGAAVAEVYLVHEDWGKHSAYLSIRATGKLPPAGTKLYTHAERASVPDVPAIMAHLPDNRAATRCEMFRALALAAATQPEDAGEAELAGYVDAEQVADMKQNGGAVQIGSLSERYGRTVPVYYLHAERARVSGLARVLVDTIDNECEHVTSDAVWAAKERLQRQLAAAPSQPEDAA